ncbi:hypothetical protein DFQ30_000447 [Apophysomyces sp. BC1015]|nr:hypothetical protein DFQ30_000447 [Apophysomyces sp. BC1015]
MADNAKMHFNIGLIFATVDDHERALAAYSRSISMDPYFAVAYFQKGVSQFVMNNMDGAMQDFDNAYQKLRGNQIINYTQLGLAFRLYSCEVLFNRGICQLYLGKIDAGLTDLYHAQKAKMTEEHDVIDQAVRDRGKGYSVYSIPPGVLYRPPESRLRQMNGVDMFAVVDQLGITKQQKPVIGGIKRNNSILLPDSRFPRRPTLQTGRYEDNALISETPIRSTVIRESGPGTPPQYAEQPSPVQSLSSSHFSRQQQPKPYAPTERRRNDSSPSSYPATDDWADASSSTSSFSSSIRHRTDGRRVDSGFESAYEDRYSSSSRNSTRSHKTNRYSPPPVPPIPRSQSAYDEFDTSSYGAFDQELDEVYGSLGTMTVHDRERDRIRERLNSNNMEERRGSEQSGKSSNSIGKNFTPQPSTSASTTASGKDTSGGKIKLKVHYTDTRILMVPSNITFEDLLNRVREKFNAPMTMRLQYKDEDEEFVLMIDEDDLKMARQINRIRSGDSGVEKMEIWCLA